MSDRMKLLLLAKGGTPSGNLAVQDMVFSLHFLAKTTNLAVFARFRGRDRPLWSILRYYHTSVNSLICLVWNRSGRI